MKTTIKLRSVLKGAHVHTDVFVGPSDGTLAFTGSLTNDVAGFQLLALTLRRGAERMEGVAQIVFEGDMPAIIDALVANERKVEINHNDEVVPVVVPTTELVLCYVEHDDGTCYFTSKPLSEQWGVHWDDAPYEHNAGDPYQYRNHDRARGERPYVIVEVLAVGDSPYQDLADHRRGASAHSVQNINQNRLSWLASRAGHDAICAGDSYGRVRSLIEKAGGITDFKITFLWGDCTRQEREQVRASLNGYAPFLHDAQRAADEEAATRDHKLEELQRLADTPSDDLAFGDDHDDLPF